MSVASKSATSKTPGRTPQLQEVERVRSIPVAALVTGAASSRAGRTNARESRKSTAATSERSPRPATGLPAANDGRSWNGSCLATSAFLSWVRGGRMLRGGRYG